MSRRGIYAPSPFARETSVASLELATKAMGALTMSGCAVPGNQRCIREPPLAAAAAAVVADMLNVLVVPNLRIAFRARVFIDWPPLLDYLPVRSSNSRVYI